MESATSRPGVDLAARPNHAALALGLAIFSIVASVMAWDLFSGGGFVLGIPTGVAAIVLAVRTRRESDTGRGMALAAIIIAGLGLAQMAIYTVVSVAS